MTIHSRQKLIQDRLNKMIRDRQQNGDDRRVDIDDVEVEDIEIDEIVVSEQNGDVPAIVVSTEASSVSLARGVHSLVQWGWCPPNASDSNVEPDMVGTGAGDVVEESESLRGITEVEEPEVVNEFCDLEIIESEEDSE